MGVNASASLITQIKAHLPSLTKAEQRVASYITENPESVIFQSVSDLADCSKTSDATVVRTCKRLGFSSYQEFKVLLAQAIASSDQVINGTFVIEENASAASITNSVFDCTIQALRLTQKRSLFWAWAAPTQLRLTCSISCCVWEYTHSISQMSICSALPL